MWPSKSHFRSTRPAYILWRVAEVGKHPLFLEANTLSANFLFHIRLPCPIWLEAGSLSYIAEERHPGWGQGNVQPLEKAVCHCPNKLFLQSVGFGCFHPRDRLRAPGGQPWMLMIPATASPEAVPRQAQRASREMSSSAF